MHEMKVLTEWEILGSPITVYGTVEEPLFLVRELCLCIGRSRNIRSLSKWAREEDQAVRTIFNGSRVCHCVFVTEKGLVDALDGVGTPLAKKLKDEARKKLQALRTVKEDHTIQDAPEVLRQWNLSGKQLTVYGTEDEPLFRAVDVARLAGCADLSSRAIAAVPEGHKIRTRFPNRCAYLWMLTPDGCADLLGQIKKPEAHEAMEQIRCMLGTPAGGKPSKPRSLVKLRLPLPFREKKRPDGWDADDWLARLTCILQALQGAAQVYARMGDNPARRLTFARTILELGSEVFVEAGVVSDLDVGLKKA